MTGSKVPVFPRFFRSVPTKTNTTPLGKTPNRVKTKATITNQRVYICFLSLPRADPDPQRAQVFGSKTIILAPPDSTPNLYPHEHFILNNTSQIVDAKAIDYERFPRARDVRFRRLELRRGQVLYIPPGWWHYVESLAPSFSVSFWFD